MHELYDPARFSAYFAIMMWHASDLLRGDGKPTTVRSGPRFIAAFGVVYLTQLCGVVGIFLYDHTYLHDSTDFYVALATYFVLTAVAHQLLHNAWWWGSTLPAALASVAAVVATVIAFTRADTANGDDIVMMVTLAIWSLFALIKTAIIIALASRVSSVESHVETMQTYGLYVGERGALDASPFVGLLGLAGIILFAINHATDTHATAAFFIATAVLVVFAFMRHTYVASGNHAATCVTSFLGLAAAVVMLVVAITCSHWNAADVLMVILLALLAACWVLSAMLFVYLHRRPPIHVPSEWDTRVPYEECNPIPAPIPTMQHYSHNGYRQCVER
jgi:hypothetical protein